MKTRKKPKAKNPVKINIDDTRVSWVLDHTGVLHYECYPTYKEHPGIMTLKEFEVLRRCLRKGKFKGVVCWLNNRSFDLYADDSVEDFSERRRFVDWLGMGQGIESFGYVEEFSKARPDERALMLHRAEVIRFHS